MAAARALKRAAVNVILIDRANHHLFQPLLYQVALGVLSASDITQPLRTALRRATNVQVVLDEVTRIDPDLGRIAIGSGSFVPYDYLVISAGTVTNYFGMASVERNTIGLKDLAQANAIRSRILRNFERATVERDAAGPGRHRTARR